MLALGRFFAFFVCLFVFWGPSPNRVHLQELRNSLSSHELCDLRQTLGYSEPQFSLFILKLIIIS